ncbi:MAG: replicative DNA helicase [Mangrovibacterium sp.]
MILKASLSIPPRRKYNRKLNLKKIGKMEYGKIPPQAIDVERAVLGALILESDSYLKVSSILKPESFYNAEHQLIFKSIKELSDSDKQVDLLTLTQYFKGKGNLEEIGGPFYLTQLTSNVASATHIEHHARIIQQKYVIRELIRIAQTIEARAFEDSGDEDDLLSWSRDMIENIDNITQNDGKTTDQVARQAIIEIEEDCARMNAGESVGINTGLLELNKAIGGWKAPYFVVLGARPSVGKTTIALNFATTAAKLGFCPNVYSYEMVATDLFKIALSGESEVNRTAIRDGLIRNQDWEKINIGLNSLEKYSILWYDDPDIKASQIRANTYKNKKAGKCDLVIIDYLQLVPVEDKKASREQQISEISRILKRITTKLKVPVIALSQLNRDVEKRSDPETFPSDLRESGSLEQDADIILLPYNILDMKGEIEERILKIAKNRRGKIGKIKFKVNSDMTKIFDDDPVYINSDPYRPISAPVDFSTSNVINEDFENDTPF